MCIKHKDTHTHIRIGFTYTEFRDTWNMERQKRESHSRIEADSIITR